MTTLAELRQQLNAKRLAMICTDGSRLFPFKCCCGMRFSEHWHLAQHIWRINEAKLTWPCQDETQRQKLLSIHHQEEKAA